MQQQMGFSGDGGGGAAAGFEPTRLSRFRSAPASWFDSLLPDDELLPQTQCLSQAPVNNSSTTNFRNSENFSSAEADPNFFQTSMAAPGHSSFFRQNSFPTEFFSQLNSPSGLGCDEFGSSFMSSLEFPPLPDIHSNKRSREGNSEQAADNLAQLGVWSSGMILALGARGREFDSRNAPGLFFFFLELDNSNAELCVCLLMLWFLAFVLVHLVKWREIGGFLSGRHLVGSKYTAAEEQEAQGMAGDGDEKDTDVEGHDSKHDHVGETHTDSVHDRLKQPSYYIVGAQLEQNGRAESPSTRTDDLAQLGVMILPRYKNKEMKDYVLKSLNAHRSISVYWNAYPRLAGASILQVLE
ncbi:hypothetical protein NE237_005101 [Protea cynaroides]|uniref:Uncharacterized protein n=1 Tax=Protea cynaroides TaxID=273540 RepID=A0A9Q0KK36_9MAGN|nr:hypothetical protein NE237_005101 [Protea cynaroides]